MNTLKTTLKDWAKICFVSFIVLIIMFTFILFLYQVSTIEIGWLLAKVFFVVYLISMNISFIMVYTYNYTHSIDSGNSDVDINYPLLDPPVFDANNKQLRYNDIVRSLNRDVYTVEYSCEDNMFKPLGFADDVRISGSYVKHIGSL